MCNKEKVEEKMNKLDMSGYEKILNERLIEQISPENFSAFSNFLRELECTRRSESNNHKCINLLLNIVHSNFTPAEKIILAYIAGYFDSLKEADTEPIGIPQVELTYQLLKEKPSFLDSDPQKEKYRIILECGIKNYTKYDFSGTIQFPGTKVEEIKFSIPSNEEKNINRLVPEDWLFLPELIKINQSCGLYRREFVMCNSGKKRGFWDRVRLLFTPDLEIIWQSRYETIVK